MLITGIMDTMGIIIITIGTILDLIIGIIIDGIVRFTGVMDTTIVIIDTIDIIDNIKILDELSNKPSCGLVCSF